LWYFQSGALSGATQLILSKYILSVFLFVVFSKRSFVRSNAVNPVDISEKKTRGGFKTENCGVTLA
ncbi:MAG TPA: hypothetical protein PKL92_07055, partial [Aquaticitalea sp.]|nr:hypothetical protein [Aquaticitalea sp.]